MKFLIDTNVFIPLEPTALSDVEAATPAAAELARLIWEAGHQLYVHPAARVDISRDADEDRRKLREILFKKYPSLPDPPSISSRMEGIFGHVEPDTNDWVDHHLVAALEADSADFLVTEDRAVIRKAARLDLQNRVATVAESASIVRDLFNKVPLPPPAVRSVAAHTLDEADPIFRSFRKDYAGFDEWLRKCKREHRQAWIVEAGGASLAAVCIIKQEKSVDFGLVGKLLKICSLKVSEEHNGFRFGELMLKAVFEYASSNRYDWIYVTVFYKHANLIRLFEDFGFQDTGCKTKLGEIILAKPMSFTEADRDSLEPLSFNIRYGPFAVTFKNIPTFVVPIKPRYHRLLFPEGEKQLELIPGMLPCGNSIRKAYLSNAAIRTITPGSNLLFYRSEDLQSATFIGVVEATFLSSSPTDIARYVAKRTVYSFSEIEALCHADVLAILLRQARILKHPITLSELMKNGVLSAAPQSIITVPREVAQWLQTRIDE